MSRRSAWQYAVITGIGFWLLLMLGGVIINRIAPDREGLGRTIVRVSLVTVSVTLGGTWARQRRLRRGSRQRYGEPGPMLPYAGLNDARARAVRTEPDRSGVPERPAR